MLALVLFRVCNGFLVWTWFDPDETWQSVEVAHRRFYGQGALTWEWAAQLRGYLFPLLFQGLFAVMHLAGVDSAAAVVWAPRVLQSLAAAWTDISVYRLARRVSPFPDTLARGPGPDSPGLTSRIFGGPLRAREGFARGALVCHVLCGFVWFCAVRTYSNCLETALVTAALVHWPLPRAHPRASQLQTHRDALAFALAGLAFVVRPTSAVVFLCLLLVSLCLDRKAGPESAGGDAEGRMTAPRLVLGAGVGFLCVAFGALVDRAATGQWILPVLQFARFNVVEGGGSLYGTHPWHWYATSALPVVLGPALILAAVGGFALVRSRHTRGLKTLALARLSLAGLLSLVAYSALSSHKEFRFLLPLVPLGCIVAALGLALIADMPSGGLPQFPVTVPPRIPLLLLLVLNVPMAVYLGCFHQRAPMAVAEWLRGAEADVVSNVLFLIPCHNAPLYSHVHPAHRVDLAYLDCSPPGHRNYPGEDDSDRFRRDPLAFVTERYEPRGSAAAPGTLIVFDDHALRLKPWLDRLGYGLCPGTGPFPHTHFPERRSMLALCR